MVDEEPDVEFIERPRHRLSEEKRELYKEYSEKIGNKLEINKRKDIEKLHKKINGQCCYSKKVEIIAEEIEYIVKFFNPQFKE